MFVVIGSSRMVSPVAGTKQSFHGMCENVSLGGLQGIGSAKVYQRLYVCGLPCAALQSHILVTEVSTI